MKLVLLSSLLLLPLTAWGQGCAMCNTTAAQAEAHQRRALNRGIVVLGVPAFLFLSGIGLAAYRSEKREDPDDYSSESKQG